MKRQTPGKPGRVFNCALEPGARQSCRIMHKHRIRKEAGLVYVSSTDEEMVQVHYPEVEYKGEHGEETEILFDAIGGGEPGTTKEVPVFVSDKPLGEGSDKVETITLKIKTLPGPPEPPEPHVDTEPEAPPPSAAGLETLAVAAAAPPPAIMTPPGTANNAAQGATSPLLDQSAPNSPPAPLLRQPSLSSMGPSVADGYAYDICMMFPADRETHELSTEGKTIVATLQLAGFRTKVGTTTDGHTVLCLLNLSLDKFKELADEQDVVLKLDSDALRNRVAKGWPAPQGLGPESPHSMIAPCVLATSAQWHACHEGRKEPERIFQGHRTLTYMKDYVKADVHDADKYAWDPFDFMYGKYDTNERIQELFEVGAPELNHPFGDLQRIQIMLTYLDSLRVDGLGPAMTIREVEQKGLICKNGIFPVHDMVKLKHLRSLKLEHPAFPVSGWLIPYPHKLNADTEPMDPIMTEFRSYFGEKLALYFAFQIHLTSYLFFLCILSGIFTLELWGTDNYDTPGLAMFSMLVSMWGVVMLDMWTRSEHRLSCKWGTTDFEAQETERPEFSGVEIWSFYGEGQHMQYYPPAEQWRRKNEAYATVSVLVLTVMLLVFICYWTRQVMVRDNLFGIGAELGPSIASAMNLVQITVMEALFTKVARDLNDKENWRTDTEYEDALIFKMFFFNFVNSYAGLYYLAFMQERFDRDVESLSCHGAECVSKLSMALFVVMIGKIGSGNGKQLFKPFFAKIAKQCKRKLNAYKARMRGTPATPATTMEEEEEKLEEGDSVEEVRSLLETVEAESLLDTYDLVHDSIQDYNQLMQYFGYAILFVVAAPWATIVAFVGNLIEIRLDSHKLLYFHRRPLPRKAQDIGTWLTIFKLFVAAAIVTNAATLTFTLSITAEESSQTRVWIFIFVLMASKTVASVLECVIPDVPEVCEIHERRQEFLVSKFLDLVPDEEELVRKALDGMLFVSYDHDRSKPDLMPGHLQALGEKGIRNPCDIYNLSPEDRQMILKEVGFTESEVEALTMNVMHHVQNNMVHLGLAALVEDDSEERLRQMLANIPPPPEIVKKSCFVKCKECFLKIKACCEQLANRDDRGNGGSEDGERSSEATRLNAG